MATANRMALWTLVTLIFINVFFKVIIADSQGFDDAHKVQKRRAQQGAFQRGSVEFNLNHLAMQYSGYNEEFIDDGVIPLRSAVEHVPINAEVYTGLDDNDDTVGFSRSSVESYPFQFVQQVQNDDVVVTYSANQDEEDSFGHAGIRSSVESPPNRDFGFNNAVHFKAGGPQNVFDQTGPTSSFYKPLNYFKSIAGADLTTYQGSIRQSNSDYRIVCYHGAWSVYREPPFDFSVSDIDPFACTHIVYAFAGIDEEELTIVPQDPDLDVTKGGYKSSVALKSQNPQLKVIIGLGGYGEGGRKFSRMSATPEGRAKFIKSAVSFLDEHGFDGIMFDWEYPGASDRGGRIEDKENFATLTEKLREAFRPKGYILAATVSPVKYRIDQGYDVPRLSRSLDFFSVTTYDLRGDWDGIVDHHAPLRSRSTDLPGFENLNIEDGIGYWIESGAPRDKLLLGVPFYGRSYTLEDPTKPTPGSRARNVGKEGRHTKEQGFMSYYEVCTEQRNGGWKLANDEIGGPYMSKNDQWISYDDPEYVQTKMNWLKKEGLGGAMIWAIDLDDYLGLCGKRWPLLSTVRTALLSDHAPLSPVEHFSAKSTLGSSFSALSTRETYPEVTTVLKPANSPRCTEGEYRKDPSDCASYLVCVHGDFAKFSCKAPLVWNHEKSFCDWKTAVTCTSSGGGDTDASVPVEITPEPYPQPSMDPTTRPPPPKPPVDLTSVTSSGTLSGDYKVVCYFTNWAWYRPGLGKYKPENIDPTVCTHIVYGFAVLDYSNLIIKPHDTWADFDNKFYEQVTNFKNHGIKVTIAIGGWNDSQGDKYSKLVNNPSARSKFINHVVEFIIKHNFDGLDLDWEYPVCWQVNCNKGPKSDKEGFALWVKELSAALRPRGLLLSAAVSPSKKVIDEGYNVPVLSHYMDWIAVMTYDFHGQWDKKTGHVAPLYYHPEDDFDYFNMDFAIRYWLEKGATKDKIVLGMPMYGQSFTLNDPNVNGLNSPARTGGTAGQFTRAKGFLAYYEICHAIQNGWTVVKDPEGRMGPYAYSGNQWVSFDDVDTIRSKSEYIRDMGLAGGMVWALDLDDFRNRCGQGVHPLMNTIKDVLGPSKSGNTLPQETSLPHPEPEPEPEPRPEPKPVHDASIDLSNTGVVTSGPMSQHQDDYKVVCYFTNWAWYRNGEGKYKPEDIDGSLCTHIIYGFAVLDNSKLIIKPHDTWADYDNKFYKQVTDYKNQGVKVLVAIGGWNDSAGGKYSKLVNNPEARRRFTEHVIRFIIENNFDGLDLDWEYPVCWQVACNKGPASDKQAFAAWVMELKKAFEPHGLLLSAAVSPSNKVIDHGYDVPILSHYLDWIAVMTYDYHGQWDKKTGHVSPMYQHPEDDNTAFNTNFTIHYWIEKGADRKKLILGLPMYGQSFTLAQSSNNGLNQKSYGGGTAGPYTRARGFLAYYEICYFIQHQKWTVVRDPLNSMGPYAYKGNQWVGFDDIGVIREKSEWIKSMGLGGGMIWALDLDDFKNRCGCERHPLLRTINRVLRGYNIPDPGCEPFSSTISTRLPHTPVIPNPTPVIRPATENCADGSYKRHESECSKFYQCIFGEFQIRVCFPGLHWDGQDRCDWPKSAGCETQGMTPAPMPSLPVTVPALLPPPVPKPVQLPAPVPVPPPAPVPVPPPKPISPITYPIGTGTGTAGSSDYKVVCYFTNWAWYRQGAGKYKPEDIDFSLCTHIVYGFAVLDSNRLLIKPHDTWADYDNKFYEKVTALKKHGVKVLLAIGGWNDSLGSKYSKLVNDPAARRRFVEHVLLFIQKHNFDGLDLDWEYPKCWQVDCKKGPASDKAAFSAWIKELHSAFEPHGLLLSAAVSPSFKVMDEGYDVPVLNRYLDWIAVMTYDYHGHWDKKTGHVAPMYYHPDDETPQFNANYTIHYWLERGASRKKLVMGMPLYGQAFSLSSATNNGLNQVASKGRAGEFTKAAGFLAYYEICDRIRNRGYTVVKDPEGRMGPYAYSGNQWVGFDDVEMIRYKSNWIKSMGLGGGMIWALDLDDFRNRCGCENHPLLRTINRELRGYSIPDPGCGF